MKKIKLIVRIVTVVLVVLLVVGVILQITNDHSFSDTAYEIIGFSVGIVGMILAVIAQLGSERQERDFEQLEDNVRQILETEQVDMKISRKILDEVVRKKPARKVSSKK